ncbi:protein boule-like isoform X2 [Babylonia areolata]|uniref:protein boule-like isoform X2 n=1 Tax=Babylonia areolata TaxID=304850 RepID=UPI003FCF2C1B
MYSGRDTPKLKGKAVEGVPNVRVQNMSSTDVSPSGTPSSTPLMGTHAPKFGTVIPSRIFVGGIAANTAETELKQYFSAFGPVKDAKIIADRAGVSKGYGFVTFENQEDADRIIKKEADNLIFKDRKLNIGPAVRKQVLPRPYDSSIPPGTVLFTNGVPYTYQNGMAIFQSPEGSYPVPQPQPAYTATVMMPPAQTVYMAPQYSPYQPTTPPQWTTQPTQWRWGPQSPSQQALTSNPGYVWAAMHASPDLMYAQPPPPQTYQTAEMDPTFVEGAPVEGSVIPVEQSLAARIHTPVSDVNTNEQTAVSTVPVVPMQTPTTKAGNIVTNYKKPYAMSTRRSFNTPTILVKHGHKVQRVMVSSSTPPTLYNGQILNPSDSGDDSHVRYTTVTAQPAN